MLSANVERKKSTASWGLRPRRLAAFGRPGSLKRSSHPASPMMNRLRRRAFVCLGMMATVTLLPPAHRLDQPLQMAFQKSQTDRAACDWRGQGRRKRPRRRDFRAAQLHSRRRIGFRASESPTTLRAFPERPIFRREIRLNASPPDQMNKRPLAVEYSPPDDPGADTEQTAHQIGPVGPKLRFWPSRRTFWERGIRY